MFQSIPLAPADPILGLTDAFNADSRDTKINLGVGVFKNEQGQTPILESVKKAEAALLEKEVTKGYLSISGAAAYALEVQKLLFGADSNLIAEARLQSAQTPGGTGALRVAAEFLVRHAGVKTIWISDPTWANHNKVFEAAGLTIKKYRYYDAASKGLDFAAMQEDLSQIPATDAVLLHGCCHNPTGVDPTAEQWTQLAEVAKAKGWLPFFDFAYQGFGVGVEEDAQGVRIFADSADEMLVCSSFSKNFGLYNERVGAVTLMAADKQQAVNAFSQIKSDIRSIYSNPPAHGALVVTEILQSEELKALWLQELDAMRERILSMRTLFVEKLQALGVEQDFSFIAQQKGMFSFSGLSPEQVEILKQEHAVYAVSSGRINVAGMTLNNIDTLCAAVAKVL